MNAALFDQLSSTLSQQGPEAAIHQLCEDLRTRGEYNALFYALLLKKRHQLGVNPIPTGPSDELPPATHEPYEEAIREAAREVGNLFLTQGNIQQAWPFFRMIGEVQPVRTALEQLEPGEDDDIQPLIHLAFYEGVHPQRGFDWILTRYGICNAITTMSGGETPHSDDVKQHCIRALVRALYSELRARLTAEVEAHQGFAPTGSDAPPDSPGVIARLIEGRDYLFGEDAYHIDTSHLSSVVQMSMLLSPCPELKMARELCAYGSQLKGRFMGRPDDPPFDNGYRDYDVYLGILSGEDVEGGLAHFRAKAEQADPEEVGTYPAEVLVNLLLKLNRGPEALKVAQQFLAGPEVQTRQLSCPSLNELCQRFRAYDLLSQVARDLNDPVFYLAGLLAARK